MKPKAWDDDFDKEFYTDDEIKASDDRAKQITDRLKREKVINGLECCAVNHVDCYKLDDCPYKNAEDNNIAVCVDILMCDALKLIKELELLKVQGPVEPRIAHEGKADEKTTWWYACGICGSAINQNDKYCHECGRAVKWE